MDFFNTPTKRTTRGILLFLLILVVCFIFPDIVRFFQKEESFVLHQMNVKQEEKINRLTNFKSRSFSFSKKKQKLKAPPSKFNPNEYSIKDWMYIGLSEKQAAVVLKFTKYRLKSNADLKKIFIISDELYELIKDSTIYPETNFKNEYPKNEYAVVETKIQKYDLNSVTEEELLKIRGIGPFFAKQIIKKRDQLGGFYRYDQLIEVWKVTEENMVIWSPSLEIDLAQIRKININTVSAEELTKHPYFSWNVANSVVKIREQNGRFLKIESIKKSHLITEELFEKLKPYLTL